MDAKDRLVHLLGMLGSAHDGEVLNAARAVLRTLGSMNMTWAELLQGNNDRQAIANAAYDQGFRDGIAANTQKAKTKIQQSQDWPAYARALQRQTLTSWEKGFVENFISRGWDSPTPKQEAVFRRMANKYKLPAPDDDFNEV